MGVKNLIGHNTYPIGQRATMDNAVFFKRLQTNISSLTANLFKASPGGATRTHLHSNRWHITYTVRGKGICVVEHKRYVLNPGIIYLVYPHEIHLYKADRHHPYTIYFLHIECSGAIPPAFPRTIKAGRLNKTTLQLFGKLTYLSHRSASPLKHARMMALLSLLLVDLMDMTMGINPDLPPAHKNRQVFSSILEQLNTPPFHFPGINTLAKSARMSRRNFTQAFRKVTGLSVKQYHMTCRMTYAKMLVDNDEFILKEIAHQCGYTNAQNFTRAYQHYYRRQLSSPWLLGSALNEFE